MQIEAIPMLINGDFLNAPLDVKMHLADYKMYGEDSYVFQQKELLHGLYECTHLSMNDKELSAEALDYLLKNNKNIGEALSNVYGIERKDILSTLSTMSAVAASPTAMTAVLNSSTAMTAVLDSETAIGLIVAAQYVNIKPFILKINGNKEYIKKLFMLVLNNSRFKLLYNGNVSSVINTYENKQGIITFSCLGFSGSSGDNLGVSSRVYNNGELIKDTTDASYTTNATPDKANAVTIGKTKWEYNHGRYNYANITCAVYEKIA